VPTFDFQKLGMDRMSQNIKRAVDKPTGKLTTGDITKGEIVKVTVTAGDTTGTATVTSRRTGAIPIAFETVEAQTEWGWAISGTILTVTMLAEAEDTVATFWVF
jgi:hypothetical protein